MHKRDISLKTESINKKFGNTLLFRNINIDLKTGDSFYITGPNGSGKSTLLQIIAGIQKPSSGIVTYSIDDKAIGSEYFRYYYGFTGPQVNPYDMLTSVENIKFTSAGSISENIINEYLGRFDLYRHRAKPVKYYSSGMKQRLRLIHALINDPQILLLDEPCSNLDTRGRDILYSILDEQKKNKLIIIATNETEDINICARGINLEQNFK